MRISTAQFQRESIIAMLQRQSELSRTQQQVSTGRRILTPADDPAGAARALDLTKAVANFEQYIYNGEQAKLRLGIEESVLEQVGSLLQRVRDLALQANNATNDAQNRRQIGAEVEQLFEQLVQLANSSDGKGEYLFSGVSSRTRPFERDGGEIVFMGDQAERMVQAGPARQLSMSHSGFDVFMKIPNGNGTFVADGLATNQGTGQIVNTTVLDAVSYQPETHRIDFVTNAAGELAYTVTNVTTGDQVIPALPAIVPDDAPTFVPDQAITFNGVSIVLRGEPAPGDAFEVAPSRSQSLFTTVQNVVKTLMEGGDSPSEKAAVHNSLGRALEEIDLGLENILRVRAEVGGRINAIEAEVESNTAAMLDMEQALSAVEDLDYAWALSQLSLQLVGVQAAEQGYVKVQGLSLFKYIR